MVRRRSATPAGDVDVSGDVDVPQELNRSRHEPTMLAKRRLRSVACCLATGGRDVDRGACRCIGAGSRAPTSTGAAAAAASSPFPTVAAIGVVPTRDPAEAVRQLYEHGVCILAGVLPAGVGVAALRDAAVSTAKQHGRPSAEADPTHDITGVFSIDADYPAQTFVEHVAGERVLAVLDEIFATTPRDYRVHSSTAQVNKPGCQQAAWHIDSWISQLGFCPAPHAHIRCASQIPCSVPKLPPRFQY